MNDEDVILYHVPGQMEIPFIFEPHQKEFHLKWLYGTANIDVGYKSIDLLPGIDFILSLWNCLTPTLKTETECEFEIEGDHYIQRAVIGTIRTSQNLFSVSPIQNGFVFVLDAIMQLQIFVGASNDPVLIQTVRGMSEILGREIVEKNKYRLLAGSSVVINSLDDEPYSIAVYGKKRRVQISFLEKDILKCMEKARVRIHSLRLTARNYNLRGPNILVVGPEYVGKTAVCTFLLNKALEDGMEPAYIDLDVHRNICNVPGTITLREIDCVDSVCPTAFDYYEQYVLQFGNTDFNDVNLQLYLRLVHKMSNLLGVIQAHHSESCAGAIIDMCGTLGKDYATIQIIHNFFNTALVVVVGDKSYYDFVKSFVLKNTEIEFIPQPKNIRMYHKNWAAKTYTTLLLKYFHGLIGSPRALGANFSDFKVYRFNNNLTRASDYNSTNDSAVQFSGRLTECDPSIERYILGVVRDDKSYEELAFAEIDYFVYFTRVDVGKKHVTVISPVIEDFTEKVLILSEIELPKIEKGGGFKKLLIK